ncbi:hypothetical protein NLJ89_g9746 [Agrocybe chaxingu]|uniref:Uncharacterized protein n=1 Tax=Agrocybe chaxingu TaxID=84603 RepID=A0A9W8MPK0_9AGAR|nr:hypothetical protein NLJ89_g9746 [Agrocybe chaxingu]
MGRQKSPSLTSSVELMMISDGPNSDNIPSNESASAVSANNELPTLSNVPARTLTRAAQPPVKEPPSRHTTFPLPSLHRPNLTSIRVTNLLTNRFDLYHIGQVAAYIATDNSIRSRRFKPNSLPVGYEEFVAFFNASASQTGSFKRFATFDFATNTPYTNGEKITLEDFHIDPALIGWRRVLSPKRQRLLEQLLWQNVEAGSNRGKKRKFSSHVPTESSSSIQYPYDDDDSSNGAAAMVF